MHARPRPPAPLLYGALIVHTTLSAGTYLIGKRALAELPALPLGLIRFSGASIFLALLLLRLKPRDQRLPPKEIRRKLLVLSFIAVPLNQGFFLYGLQSSTPAHAALLYALTPLFVLLLAQALLGEFPGWRTAAGTAMALGGTIFVLFEHGLDLSNGPLFGDLMLFIAVVAWSVYTAEGRELVSTYGALPTIAWTIIAGTILFFPLGLAATWFARERVLHASPQAWLGVLYLIVATSVISYLIWYWALGHLAAARVAIFNNLQPLATALLAYVFLGDRITPAFIGGAIVVIAGVLFAQRGARYS
jgi:drug/metabolite transporter (DMT)-like permease